MFKVIKIRKKAESTGVDGNTALPQYDGGPDQDLDNPEP